MPKETFTISVDSRRFTSRSFQRIQMQNSLSSGAVWIFSYGTTWMQSHRCIECFCMKQDMEQDMAEIFFGATSLTFHQQYVWVLPTHTNVEFAVPLHYLNFLVWHDVDTISRSLWMLLHGTRHGRKFVSYNFSNIPSGQYFRSSQTDRGLII